MFKRGTDSFEALFKKWYIPLLGYACRFTSTEDAENIVQDLMLDIWERRKTLVVTGDIGNYLFNSVKHRCLNLLDHKLVHEKYLSAKRFEMVGNLSCESESFAHEITGLVNKTLDCLPEEQSQAFRLNRFDGLTFKEIAIKTGVHEKTVEYRISKALEAVRKSLEDYLGQ